MTVLHTLLSGLVDYAGLFPPAALDMTSAVRQYAAYRAERDAWMLGRFVVPVARLDDLVRAREALDRPKATGDPEWRLTALAGSQAPDDVATACTFNEVQAGRITIDSIEAKGTSPSSIAHVAVAALAHGFTLFVEVPSEPDPAPLIAAIAEAGVAAKIRTGGVTSGAIPPVAQVIRFIRRCLEAGIPFKATAGLHHPLRGEYRLTYESDAPTGSMYGYLNVFLAAAFMRQGMSDADAARLLCEASPDALVATPSAIHWQDASLSEAQVREARETVAMSFGSCSFREPVDEIRAIPLGATL